MRLPTRSNCLGSNQSQTNRLSVHERIEYNDIDQRVFNRSAHDQLGKRSVDESLIQEEEEHAW